MSMFSLHFASLLPPCREKDVESKQIQQGSKFHNEQREWGHTVTKLKSKVA